ncbi:hypothetical protein JWG39_06250 [Desulforhopalus vacuolatus]|uniref:hypothetical protein n=1 Tax=Desulforhopalus vacuolatus TaxID=40414 RepID=UPI001962664E|nr:hypothetical protein [Desulforhopalus vacuolatus]MBM9519421.1 hypothetical protein [Desulforhopalus vacuolatus]
MKKSYKSGAKTLLFATVFTAGSILCGASAGLAVDNSADASMARQLQLEGTRLQLKGDLAGALEKYQQSLKLKANPRLEKISRRIAEKTGKTAAGTEATEAVVQEVVAPVAPTDITLAAPVPPKPEATEATSVAKVQEVPAAGVASATETAQPAAVPASPEEARIRNMVSRMITMTSTFSGINDSEVTADNILQIDPNYTVTPWIQLTTKERQQIVPEYTSSDEGKYDNTFSVNLGKVGIKTQSGETISIDAPFILKVEITAKDKLFCSLILPPSIPLTSEGKPLLEITSTASTLEGVWDEDLNAFTTTLYKMTSPKFFFAPKKNNSGFNYSGGMASVNFKSVLDTDGPDWNYKTDGNAEDFSFYGKDIPLFTIGAGRISYSVEGREALTLRSLIKEYVNCISSFQESIAANNSDGIASNGETFFHIIDSALKIYSKSNSNFQLNNINISNPEQSESTFHIDGINLTSEDSRTAQGNIVSNTLFTFNSISSLITEGEQQPTAINIDEVSFKFSGGLEKIPENFFVSNYKKIKPMIKSIIDESADEDEIAGIAIEISRNVLSLLRECKENIAVNNVEVKGPFNGKLANFTLAQGITAGGGKDNSISHNIRFSGLDIPAMAAFLPTDANIDIKALQLPPLLSLIPDAATTTQLIKDDTFDSYFQSKILEESHFITGVLDNNYITFANAAIKLNGRFQQDSSSPVMAQGKAVMEIENADNINTLLQSLPNGQQLQGPLTMLTSFANRTTADGKTTDTIKLVLTPEGKIMVNDKDLTGMFFPQQTSAPEETVTPVEESVPE